MQKTAKIKHMGTLGDPKTFHEAHKSVLGHIGSLHHLPGLGKGNMVLIGLKWESWGRDREKFRKIVAQRR